MFKKTEENCLEREEKEETILKRKGRNHQAFGERGL